eukprot:g19941.t1
MALLAVAEAKARLLGGAHPVKESELLALDDCAGRVLAEDLLARLTQPPFDASAMDGYALASRDAPTIGAELKVIGSAAAGHGFKGELGPGQAVRIFTGAPVPSGADTILIQEDAQVLPGDLIRVGFEVISGRHIRPRGQDFAEGEAVLTEGTRLDFSHLTVAAAMNHPRLPVLRRPKVAILATGDELVAPGETPAPAQIIASNTFGIAALIRDNGADVVDLGIARDDRAAIAAAVERAQQAGVDVLVTLGGASVGDHDLVQSTLKDAGMELDFWRIAMRPGKPLMVGSLGNMHVLGLPGNPVASLVTGMLFLEPLLRRLGGLPDRIREIAGVTASTLKSNDQRQDYLRARINGNENGTLVAQAFDKQDSSMMKIFAQADGLIALHGALAAGGPLIPLYIREPRHDNVGPLGRAQEWWLHHSLLALQESLKSLGSDLIFRSGEAADVLAAMCGETGATRIYANSLVERLDLDRDICRRMETHGIALRFFEGQLLHPPGAIRTGAGTGFKVFTAFWNAMPKRGEPQDPLEPPATIPAIGAFPPSEALRDWKLLPEKPDWAAGFGMMWRPGEAGARERLAHFIDRGLVGYKRGRDVPSVDATSNLSAHLAHGEISPARVWHSARGLPPDVRDEVGHFRRELAWRDFCYNLLAELPALSSTNWDRKFDAFPWNYDRGAFHAWSRGLTGYPIVDAGMRQLWKHGFMHNRVRMITASFLIKDLMIDWRRGERWFRDTLVDADPANNAANWQWVAGSGADASPFFRIFNPVLQGEKFDPDGDYVREHVPELARLERRFIHRPFDAPAAVLEKAQISR